MKQSDYNLERDIFLSIPAGRVPYASYVTKFGYAPDGVQSSTTHIWDRSDATPTQPIWLPPTAARTHQIKSTSGIDDLTGIGCQKIQIYGLVDWNTKEVSEVINMDGVNDVPTVNQYVIIHRMKLIQGGTLGINAGIITATADVDGTVTAQININYGQTEMAIYGFPSTQTAYLTGWYASIHKASGAAVDVLFELQQVADPEGSLVGFITKEIRGLQSNGTSMGAWDHKPYKVFDGPGIILVEATGSANDIDCAAGFDLILLDK